MNNEKTTDKQSASGRPGRDICSSVRTRVENRSRRCRSLSESRQSLGNNGCGRKPAATISSEKTAKRLLCSSNPRFNRNFAQSGRQPPAAVSSQETEEGVQCDRRSTSNAWLGDGRWKSAATISSEKTFKNRLICDLTS
jgi:hypothetical protein